MISIIDFDKLIETHLKRERKQKQIGRYYPSEIGGCIRKVWYSYKYPLEIEPDKLKIFEIGNILHEFIMQVFKNEKNADSISFLESELPFKMEKKDFVISGRLDDIIVLKEDGRKIIIEVKSIRDVNSASKPNKNHVMQLQFYMHATGIKDGVILYVDKNNLKTRAFEISYDERHSLDILNRFKALHELLTKDVLPIDEAKRSKDTLWMCNMCEYRAKCDRNEG
ncbi:MAG: Dna2/Cas4 domain-containing protein [Candidatus Aenigmarchaeota archaeon]|nr:Dna2/Cas4 domain-containing protein [Candidatus Aenigmarchaeota archaeon]